MQTGVSLQEFLNIIQHHPLTEFMSPEAFFRSCIFKSALQNVDFTLPFKKFTRIVCRAVDTTPLGKQQPVGKGCHSAMPNPDHQGFTHAQSFKKPEVLLQRMLTYQRTAATCKRINFTNTWLEFIKLMRLCNISCERTEKFSRLHFAPSVWNVQRSSL